VSGKRFALFAFVLATALAAGGCGGDDEAGAEGWANSVCANLSEWVTEIDEAVKSVTDEGLALDEDDLDAAVDQARDATDDLANDLEELGPPDTEAVEQAVDEDGEPLELVATVAAALSAAADELRQTFSRLEEVDPGGELEDAFRNSEDCDSLREQVENIGS
jgi:methyl-accepting chemotaxis protein